IAALPEIPAVRANHHIRAGQHRAAGIPFPDESANASAPPSARTPAVVRRRGGGGPDLTAKGRIDDAVPGRGRRRGSACRSTTATQSPRAAWLDVRLAAAASARPDIGVREDHGAAPGGLRRYRRRQTGSDSLDQGRHVVEYAAPR